MPSMQLKLSDREYTRLANRIDENYQDALAAHRKRMERFRRYYRMWRNRVDPPEPGDPPDASNFRVPIMQWQVFGAWAQMMQGMLGSDAEIIAEPQGPSDGKKSGLVGRYMTWRMFKAMKITNPMAVFIFRMLTFGRSHAFAPWDVQSFLAKNPDTGDIEEKVWYEGPSFDPLWPDDLIVPAEDAKTIHDFSFVIRKHRLTPQQLLDGERKGDFFGIKENYPQILGLAEERRDRSWQGDEIKREMDEAEGVTKEGGVFSGNGLIEVFEWYGRWRLPKGRDGGAVNNLERRQLDETDIVVQYIPDMDKVIGAKNLVDVYPTSPYRRPFTECSLVKDGSYWSAGIGELIEMIEGEATGNHNLFTEAGMFTVGPLIFFKPSSGFNPERRKYEPGEMIPTDDPNSVKVVNIQGNLQYSLEKESTLFDYANRVTGRSDQTLGLPIKGPNAPDTASGQIALIEQGNIRVSLDLTVLREDMASVAQHIWLLDCQFSSDRTFFRVTEEDAKGLFEVRRGGTEITSEERGGRYDFTIKFATGYWSREQEKNRLLALYNILLQNPLVATNPKLLAALTRQLCKQLGYADFASMIPQPPEGDDPKTPKEEWNLMLQGDDVEIHPMDNDDLHIADHQRRIADEQRAERPDDDAIDRGIAHLIQHEQQKKQKMLMQALTQQLTRSLAGSVQSLTPGAPQMSLPQAHALLSGMLDPNQTLNAGGGNAPGGAPTNGKPPLG